MPSDIFGLKVENRSISQVAHEITSRAEASENFMVVTPNVDHFLRWQKDVTFRKLYEQADYQLIDGVPILWLARLLGDKVSERITGVDLSIEVIRLAHQTGVAVALVGGSDEAMQLAKGNLLKRFPNLDIFFTATPRFEQLTSANYQDFLAEKLSQRDRKIVLFCLGSPKQEILYSQLNEKFELSGAYLCVGGTIDFIAKLKKRAPKVLQKLGLEWAYRFMQEPARLFRRYFCRDTLIIFYFLRAFKFRISRR
jgi:N-acetylglucosaminyldiphosphoundecaprenol N-acetyl-beta-D-mannosaminyltransferase